MKLDIPNDCIFCKIIKREAPAYIVAETDNFIAFLDHQPIAYGHTLIIPKSHCVTLCDIPPHLLGEYLTFTRNLAESTIKTLNVPAFNLFQNNGAPAGQVVFHVHFHLVPRSQSDGMRYRRYLKPQTKEAQRNLAQQLNLSYLHHHK